MANNDFITTDCKLTISKDTAKLDEELFLYKNDKNIKLLIQIEDKKYRYKADTQANLLSKYKASYAQVKWYKNAEVKKEFPIQATDDGKVVFIIEGELINEDTELGDYDLQIRLLNENQESIRSLPIIKGAVHILKPLFETGDIATVNSAVADRSMLSLDGDPINTYNSDGTYNQTNWGNGDVISSARLNKLEKVAKDNVDKVNKIPAKSIVEGGKLYLAKEDGTKLDAGTALPAGGSGSAIEVINNLESDSTTAALSAAQGKVLNTQYKELANKIGTGITNNSVEPELMDMPRIYFSEGTLPTSKTATVMKFDYYSKTAAYHGYVDIKCQGNSSMAYPKKNFTIKPYKDKAKTAKLKIDFKGWGKQSKFVLKANWIDISHARNIVSARLWGDIIKTRSDYATAVPELLRTSPNQGAVDGFPVLVYSNGVYQGRYTLNIPKDKWMSNMDDALDTHCILCGENYVSGCFRALPVINGTDWTDELHDVVPAAIKTSWSNAINFVMTSSDTEFKTNLSNYFDVNSLIDYYIYGLVSTNLDGFGKNQLFFCYDGIHWIASVYDMDSTWGLYWNGSKILPTDYRRNQYEDYAAHNTSNLLYDRLEQLFIAQLKTRYAELRKDVLSASHIIQKFEEFNEVCPKDIVQEDYASTTGGGKFTGMPSLTTNNIQQLRTNIVGRLTYVDGYINALHEAIPCTNITLNNATLSFTTSDVQTLTATVTPTDTTDTVVWSVSPTGFVTVNDGVVTPINNGQCVVTATCGSHSATCNVTVNLPVEAVTALNLDKDSITLGDGAGTDTSNVNLLDGVNYTKDATTNNIQFDPITLDSGVYVLKNINGGTFTWLGVDYDGVKHETGNYTADYLFKLDVSKSVTVHAFPNNIATNTVDKIGLYKVASTLINPIKFSVAGNGYYKDNKVVADDNNVYSNTVTLDSSKKYILINEGTKNVNGGQCTWSLNNGWSKNVITTSPGYPIKVFENITSLSISINTTNNALADITLYEAASATTKFEDTLTAALTPVNATNKNVTWTADNENVQLVANGLNCTVKAKAVGDSIVTCTSQDTTNGTITDACNVTVNAVPEQPNVLYALPQETTFNGTSDYIDTGVQLFKTDQDFTIIMDVTPNDSQTGSQITLMHCMKEESPYPGMTIQMQGDTPNGFVVSHGSNQLQIGDNIQPFISLGKRTKLVIVKNGTIMKAYSSNNVGKECTYNYTSIDQTLLLGAYQATNDTKGRFFKGTIHEFSIKNTVYTNEQINDYLGAVVAPVADVDYSLATPTTFNGTSDFIDTGVKLFNTAKDFTIYIDFTSGTSNKENASVFHCIYEVSPYRGLCLNSNTGALAGTYFLGGQDFVKSNAAYLGSIGAGKYLIEFKNGVISKVLNSSGELVIKDEAKTNSPYVQVNQNLLLGCYQTTDGTKGRYWNGTINKFNVWFRVLSESEISSLMNAVEPQ